MTQTILSPSFPRNYVVVDMTVAATTDTWGEHVKGDDGSGRNSSRRSLSRDETLSTTDKTTSAADSTTFSTDHVVRFDLENTVVIPVEAITDVPDFVRRAAWHDRASYDIIMGSNHLTAKLMRIGRENPEAYGHCFRGLEHRLTEVRRERDQNTQTACRAVFQEQKRQREEGTADPERLAFVYQECVKSSINNAVTLAESDMKDAAAYQTEYACQTPPSSPGVATSATEDTAFCDISALDDDDNVSVLSDEASVGEFSRYASEGRGLLKRFQTFLQQRRSSNESVVQRPSSNESRTSCSHSSRSSSWRWGALR